MTNASSQQQTLKERLTPPVHSDISALLNGMSNGAMVVGLPLLIYNVLKDDHTHPERKKVAMVVGAAGCAIGAWFGWKEAELTREYRACVAGEIRQLRDDVDRYPPHWQEREAARKEAKTSTEVMAL